MLTKTFAAISVALLLLMAPVTARSAQCAAQVTDSLETVGETRLRVMFFKVYDATLMTDSGRYPDADVIALQLSYLRDVGSEKLVETTKEQWEKLDYRIGDDEQQWLEELQGMWPDVSDGDCLLAFHKAGEGVQFYSADAELGQIRSDEFADKFFAIWLDENSSYRKNRNELIGERE
ncbi:chalcone isomerase family protein [Aliidiomarina sp. Khilg15.8]